MSRFKVGDRSGAELEYEDDALNLAIWGAGLNLSSLDEVMQDEQEKEIERAFDESRKVYYLFRGYDYYPAGGANDFVVKGTMEECRAKLPKKFPRGEWWQIVDDNMNAIDWSE